jgi:hypothetical protein
MRSINAATASSTGGRPRQFGYVHFLATKRRCQRRIVPGVTNRCPHSICGNLRTSAANTARSAQSRRGFGFALRSTTTSWRSTRSSTSFDANHPGQEVQADFWNPTGFPDRCDKVCAGLNRVNVHKHLLWSESLDHPVC